MRSWREETKAEGEEGVMMSDATMERLRSAASE